MSTNPLADYMRQISVYIALPSGGNFYKNRPDLTDDGEIGVRPMTSADEINMRIPDSLYNGESIYHVIRSCVPGIKDPTEMPYNDLEPLLLAIRRATYGDDLTVPHKCKNCGEELDYVQSIDRLLATVPTLENRYTVDVGEITVFLRPITLKSNNELQLQAVEQQQLARGLQQFSEGNEGELIKQFQQNLINVAMSNVRVLADCVYQIEMPDGTRVANPEHIGEWINNIDTTTFNRIMEKLLEVQSVQMNVDFKAECAECNTPFETQVIVDQSRFFA